MSAMETLAVANNKAYGHPMVLAIGIALSSIFVQYLGWWPRPEFGFMGYLAPFPGFAVVAVPILFAVDWHHRPFFEKEIRRFLSREDILYLTQYYSSLHTPHSRFLVLVWSKRPIGYIAVDAAAPDDDLSNLEDEERLPSPDGPVSKKAVNSDTPEVVKERERTIDVLRAKMTERIKVVKSKPLPDYAVIRHYHVDRVYVSTGVQFDLIRKALADVFSPPPSLPTGTSPSFSKKGKAKGRKGEKDAGDGGASAVTVNKVFIRISSLESGRELVFRELGFVPSKTRAPEGRAGTFLSFETRSLTGEVWTWFEIDRARWEQEKEVEK